MIKRDNSSKVQTTQLNSWNNIAYKEMFCWLLFVLRLRIDPSVNTLTDNAWKKLIYSYIYHDNVTLVALSTGSESSTSHHSCIGECKAWICLIFIKQFNNLNSSKPRPSQHRRRRSLMMTHIRTFLPLNKKAVKCQQMKTNDPLIDILIAFNKQNRRRSHLSSKCSPFSNEQLIVAAWHCFLFWLIVLQHIDLPNVYSIQPWESFWKAKRTADQWVRFVSLVTTRTRTHACLTPLLCGHYGSAVRGSPHHLWSPQRRRALLCTFPVVLLLPQIS